MRFWTVLGVFLAVPCLALHEEPKAPEVGKVAAPPCSFEELTRSCDLFDPKKVGRRISFPDGTYIPNYAFMPWMTEPGAKEEENVFAKKREEREQFETKSLAIRENLAKLITTLPAGKARLGFAIF